MNTYCESSLFKFGFFIYGIVHVLNIFELLINNNVEIIILSPFSSIVECEQFEGEQNVLLLYLYLVSPV